MSHLFALNFDDKKYTSGGTSSSSGTTTKNIINLTVFSILGYMIYFGNTSGQYKDLPI
jgi:hypothetical protein